MARDDADGAAEVGAMGCRELIRIGVLDPSGCCERCHSAEAYAPGRFSLGPCRVALPDGRKASVCCAARRRLILKAGP